MKRITCKVLIILLICIACGILLPAVTFAASFNVKFDDGYSAKPGEIIEIPLVLSSIGTDTAQNGLTDFTGIIYYDENALELVRESEDQIVKMQEDLFRIYFDQDSNKLLFSLNSSYYSVNSDAEALANREVLGTMKFKVKDNTKNGKYQIGIKDLVGQNDETTINVVAEPTEIEVYGADIVQNEETEITPDEDETSEIGKELKAAIATIKQSDDGDELIIVPDEVNGEKIGYVLINGIKVERTGDKFVFKCSAEKTYKISFYSEDGEFLSTELFTTKAKIENNTEEKSEENNNEDVGKKDSTNPKSPQTGDMVFVIVGILISVVLTLVFVEVKNRRKSA